MVRSAKILTCNVQRQVRDLQFRGSLSLVETVSGFGRWRVFYNDTDLCESLELSIVRIGLETTELRGENDVQIAACRWGEYNPTQAFPLVETRLSPKISKRGFLNPSYHRSLYLVTFRYRECDVWNKEVLHSRDCVLSNSTQRSFKSQTKSGVPFTPVGTLRSFLPGGWR